MASLWAHFTLGSGWNCLSCFGPLISKSIFFSTLPTTPPILLFFLELQGLWSLSSPCGCFHSIFCRIKFSGLCLSFISAPLIWLTFIYVLTEGELLRLNFTSLLSPGYCMCLLCSKTSSKKVLGHWDAFICFDVLVEVIGSAVLDLQDKQWRCSVTGIDLRRASTLCMVPWVCMYGLDMECCRGKRQQIPDGLFISDAWKKNNNFCQNSKRGN